MTDQTTAELIAEARGLIAHTKTYNFGMWSADKLAHEVAGKVVDALEAAEQRADLADADLEVEQQKNAGYRSRNDALAAVVEKAQHHVSDTVLYVPDEEDIDPDQESAYMEGALHVKLRLRRILASAPADALREVKADVWDEGWHVGYRDHSEDPLANMSDNPYRAREEQGRDYTPSVGEVREAYARPTGLFGHYGMETRRAGFDRMIRRVKADAIREYVEAARENPHTYYWPPSGVLDDAEQWADEIEKEAGI